MSKHVYMDDVLSGTEKEHEAIQLREQLIELAYQGGFKLREFASKSRAVLRGIQVDDLAIAESVLRIRNKEQARKLLDLEVLMDGTPIAIGYHPELNFRKFVVVCSEVEGMTDDELLKELLPQKITAVRRITKKTTTAIIGTSTLILTINSTVVPEFITFGFIRLRTRIYYPQPLICRHCLQYGHPKNKCLNEKACIVCSGNHSSDLCTAQAAARKIAETPCTISYAAVVKNQHEVYNQEKRKQHPKKQTPNDLTEQQAIQKRAHHPTEETTPAKNLTASPPSKKLTPQPSTQATEDGIEDTPQKESGKMTIDALVQKSSIIISSPSTQIPPNPPLNPFQPPIRSKFKYDHRHIKPCKK
ncbi:uncharacterized protein LOC129742829 [Uranotaenia lowii]|uniref:uncharacterized protein LOC129742829 n=1 Tax=Uranotaenia lowii TaxID=190385 RepID=UPI0024783657|nr:uncharacterized protein LOC129742829 [Uranotaenia lowii]